MIIANWQQRESSYANGIFETYSIICLFIYLSRCSRRVEVSRVLSQREKRLFELSIADNHLQPVNIETQMGVSGWRPSLLSLSFRSFLYLVVPFNRADKYGKPTEISAARVFSRNLFTYRRVL